MTGEKHWRYTRAPIWYCGHTLGPLLTLMDDRIVKATGAQAGRNKHPGETVAFIDMEVGLFQTQKGAVIKILRSQVAPRYPDMVFYSLYGTKGFVENGREGGWGATKGRLFIEGRDGQEGAAPASSTAPPSTRTPRRRRAAAATAPRSTTWCATSSTPSMLAASRPSTSCARWT